MNEGITPTLLILEASLPVQLVLLTLLGLSIVSWVMIFQRWMVLSAALKGVLSFEHRFWSGMDLSQLYKEGSQMQKEDIPAGRHGEYLSSRIQGIHASASAALNG